MKKEKEFIETEVLGNNKIGKDICVLELKNVFTKMPQPGQFIMIEPLNKESVMPRPFSIAYADKNSVCIMIKKVGINTSLYLNLVERNKLKISGPLGQPFILSDDKEYIFVAGGMGIVAVVWLMIITKYSKKSKILFGAKTKAEQYLIIEKILAHHKSALYYKTISEEGENGGTVVDLLKEEIKSDEGKSIIVACGPKGMLKAVANAARKHGNKCFVSLEEMMACGVGSCKSCAVFGIDGTVKRVCKDGPTFDAEWIDWEKIIIPETLALRKSKKTANPMRVVLRGREDRKLILTSPVMNASGCLDIEAIKKGYVDISKAGALVPKGFKLNPSLGNPTPRICETEAGMINSIGLENDGAEAFKEKLSDWLKLGKPIIANISGNTITEYFQIAEALKGCWIDAVEINVSCLNLLRGGMLFGVSPKNTLRIVRGVREILPRTFLIVKLTPNITDVIPIVEGAVRGGADAVSAINTVLGMAIDVKTRRPKIARVMGGLSGPAIKPIGVRIVRQIRQTFPCLPIIGIGGITSAEDAAEYIIAGADAVAVGTGLFKNPNAVIEIYNGLLEIMHYHGAHNISDLSSSIILPE